MKALNKKDEYIHVSDPGMAAINLNVDQMRAWLSEQEGTNAPNNLLHSLTVARDGN